MIWKIPIHWNLQNMQIQIIIRMKSFQGVGQIDIEAMQSFHQKSKKSILQNQSKMTTFHCWSHELTDLFFTNYDYSPEQIRKCQACSKYSWLQEITSHMVFVIVMDLTRNAWFEADRYLTDAHSSITCSSIVSWESICHTIMLPSVHNRLKLNVTSEMHVWTHLVASKLGLLLKRSLNCAKAQQFRLWEHFSD